MGNTCGNVCKGTCGDIWRIERKCDSCSEYISERGIFQKVIEEYVFGKSNTKKSMFYICEQCMPARTNSLKKM